MSPETAVPANLSAPQSQPVQALAGIEAPLDDAAVRQAIANAEANNQDPQTITIGEIAQAPEPKPTEVPQKFLKPDGEVDVDKITASTRQLDEAIKAKEQAVAKTVEDYMEMERKFRNLPNPEKLAAQQPTLPQPVAPTAPVSQQDYEAIVRRDYESDPLATTTRLLHLMIEEKFKPLAEKEKTEATRLNLQRLAEKDSRILREDVFSAVNAKLASDPDLWKLKNPHKAAWLEVKEEMRLGEPTQAQAQPSRPSPVLGGGTPPSAPSSSVQTHESVVGNLNALDLRDKKQEAMGDEAIRAMLAQNRG